jgi:hypothetical protein
MNPRLEPGVTVAASRSASVVRPDASDPPPSEGRAESAAVAAVQTSFPQEGYVGAANARWVRGFVVAAQAHSGWAQAGYSAGPWADDRADCLAVPMADDLIPADYSAVLMADDLIPVDYSAAPMADDLIPADCSAVPMADDLIRCYSALAVPSEQRCSLDLWRAEWPVAEPRHDSSDGYRWLPFVSPARPRGR